MWRQGFGKVVEEGSRADIIRRPAHDYTKLLLATVPVPGQRHA